jgi:hypothetical protein
VNFSYAWFATLIALNGIGSGLFAAPNTSAIMGSVEPQDRGAASGMRATFMNAGMLLSIGVFFSLMIAGLAKHLPGQLSSSLIAQGVPAQTAHQVAGLPPVGSLFAAFLGYNPMHELLGNGVLAQLPPAHAANLVGKTYFPQLISGPLHDGLVVVFLAAAAMCFIGAVLSLAKPSKDPQAEQPAASEQVLTAR